MLSSNSHATVQRPGAPGAGPTTVRTPASPKRARIKRVSGPRGDSMSKLPDRMWKLPRHEDDEAADEEGIGRILALSDGVFAIAITLLIIAIGIPATTSDAGLPEALLGLWPRYLAYVLSFLVIARFWVTHHLAFRLIARYDATLVWLNLLLLMLVAFLPFPTAVLGEHFGSPARPSCTRPRCAWPGRPPRPTGGTPPAGEACSGRTPGGRECGRCAPAA